MRTAILFTVMKVRNKISVNTIWWRRKCVSRSEFKRMNKNSTEYHWYNYLSEFECIMFRGRRNRSTDYMEQPLKFVWWDKHHTTSTAETMSHVSYIYTLHRYRIGCKEHNRADEITKITKYDEENKVPFCYSKTGQLALNLWHKRGN